MVRRSTRREIKRLIGTVKTAIPVTDPETRLRRRAAVTPARIEPGRLEVPVQLPAPIVEAAQAAAEDRAFSFAEAPPIEAKSIDLPADGDEFNFFRAGGLT